MICAIGLFHICMHACFCREEPLDVLADMPDTQGLTTNKCEGDLSETKKPNEC